MMKLKAIKISQTRAQIDELKKSCSRNEICQPFDCRYCQKVVWRNVLKINRNKRYKSFCESTGKNTWLIPAYQKISKKKLEEIKDLTNYP